MRRFAARPCRASSRLPGLWNEFAVMGWQACFQVSRMTFRSSSMPRALLVLPGAGREMFIGRGCMRFMNC
jgi:hypothetical protein